MTTTRHGPARTIRFDLDRFLEDLMPEDERISGRHTPLSDRIAGRPSPTERPTPLSDRVGPPAVEVILGYAFDHDWGTPEDDEVESA